jgi:hypothetical protein
MLKRLASLTLPKVVLIENIRTDHADVTTQWPFTNDQAKGGQPEPSDFSVRSCGCRGETVACCGIYASYNAHKVTNPSKRDAAAKKVVSAARAILAYHIGLSVGCQRMSRALTWLKPYEIALPTIFDDYLAETVGLPLGSERLEWDRKTLQQKDIALEDINRRFRDRIFDTCWTLIDRFAG